MSAYVSSSTERICGFLTKSNRLAWCRGLYSLKILVAFVSSVKIKPKTRATVSFKEENMCASALRGAIIIQGVLLAMEEVPAKRHGQCGQEIRGKDS